MTVEFILVKRTHDPLDPARDGYDDTDLSISDKDVKYMVKLINNDLLYRRKRAASRAYYNEHESDAKAISKATQLMRGLKTLLAEEGV